jgi:hypothetical protein
MLQIESNRREREFINDDVGKFNLVIKLSVSN